VKKDNKWLARLSVGYPQTAHKCDFPKWGLLVGPGRVRDNCRPVPLLMIIDLIFFFIEKVPDGLWMTGAMRL
jgi:hypothetical protein